LGISNFNLYFIQDDKVRQGKEIPRIRKECVVSVYKINPASGYVDNM